MRYVGFKSRRVGEGSKWVGALEAGKVVCD